MRGKPSTSACWKAGVAQAVTTPTEPLWLAGYGTSRPAEGKRHDLWVKALALEDGQGARGVLVTSDLVGLAKSSYERLCAACEQHYGLERAQILLTYSHNHCAPVTSEVLPDYYPFGDREWEQIAAYSRGLEERIVATVGEALARLAPATLSAGEGTATFAVNRRNNREAAIAQTLAEGQALQGPVDHSVPVLAVRDDEDRLLAVVFGYACHPTTLSDCQWCGDYPGYAQLAVEASHSGATALFWTGCGGDQNPLPRRTVALCEQYGSALAAAVAETLQRPLHPLAAEIRTAFAFVPLEFDRTPTREELERDATSDRPVRARWAQRILRALDQGDDFPRHCDYGVQVWRLGAETLWIALGGEAVVDYALRFKQEFGPRTWVCGYAHEMVGYVPSRRVWHEGGYEAEHIYEYGWLAYRWTEDTEDRVATAVARLVENMREPQERKDDADSPR